MSGALYVVLTLQMLLVLVGLVLGVLLLKGKLSKNSEKSTLVVSTYLIAVIITMIFATIVKWWPML